MQGDIDKKTEKNEDSYLVLVFHMLGFITFSAMSETMTSMCFSEIQPSFIHLIFRGVLVMWMVKKGYSNYYTYFALKCIK